MKNTIGVALLLLGASCAEPVGGISSRFDLQSVGEYTTIDQSETGRISHVFQGHSEGGYLLESFRTADLSGVPEFWTIVDDAGNYLSWMHQDGFGITYQPHNCQRTLGECSYTETRSNGEVSRWVRKTQATAVGYTYELFREGSNDPAYHGSSELDARGIAGNGTVTSPRGTQTFTLIEYGSL
jgi:hypothetical protein